MSGPATRATICLEEAPVISQRSYPGDQHILRVHAESARDAASERESNAASRRQGAPLGNGDEALGPEGPLGVDVQGLALAAALINRQLRKCASGQRFVRRIGRQAGIPGT